MAPKSELRVAARALVPWALLFVSCSPVSSDAKKSDSGTVLPARTHDESTVEPATETDGHGGEGGVPAESSDAAIDSADSATSLDDSKNEASSGASADGAEESDVDGSVNAIPTLSMAERALLSSLRYDSGPAPEDPSNAVADDPRAQLLGQRLFFDPSLSGALLEGDNDGSGGTLGHKGDTGLISCASCHVPEAYFVDSRSPHRQISLAALWTKRRTPTLLEVAFAPLYNWDGRRDSIWGQAIGVMESEREFNSSRLFVAQQVLREYRDEYTELFGEPPVVDDPEVFGELTPAETGCVELTNAQGAYYECRGKPGDGAEYDALPSDAQDAVTGVMVNAAKSIAAYVRQLRCGEGRFDAWLDGDDTALSAAELRGAALFVGRAHCVDCHSGPNLTDGAFHNVGLRPAVVAVAFTDQNDRGAAEGIAALLDDPLNTRSAFSDGVRDALPDAVGAETEGAFRTPTLRCIAEQPSFMHTGQFTSLGSVIGFFARGGDGPGGYPGKNELQKRSLEEGEQADLVAFLGALMGPGPDANLLSAPPASP